MSRDFAVESWMESLSIPWEYVSIVALDQINDANSQANRRVQTIHVDLVEQYKDAMEQGAVFPAIILRESRRGYLVQDGLHRTRGMRAIGRKHTDAYVLKTNDTYLLEVVARGANARNGMPESRDKVLEDAKYICRHFSKNATEVARSLGLSSNALQNYMRADTTKERIRIAGANPDAMPSDTATLALNPIKHAAPLREAASLVIASQMAADDVTKFSQDIRNQDSEEEELRVIEDWKNKPDIVARIANVQKGRTHAATSPRVTLLGILRKANALIDRYPTASEMQLTTPENVKELHGYVDALYDRIERLFAKEAGPAMGTEERAE